MTSGSLFPEPGSACTLPPGMSYDPHFLATPAQSELLAAIDGREWSLELKRRVQHYGYQYNYSIRQIDKTMSLGPLPAFVCGVLDKLRAHRAVARAFDQLIVNEYLPGQGIAPHIDGESCFGDCIAVISLGWSYEMEFQDPGSRSVAALTLVPGSLLVLSGPARYEWTHQIRPRLKDHGVPRRRRVSLTFRQVLLGE